MKQPKAMPFTEKKEAGTEKYLPQFDQLIELKRYIKEKGKRISLEEAIIRGRKGTAVAFAAIQILSGKSLPLKRRWYPQLRLNNGTPFAGYTWGTFIEDNYGMRGRACLLMIHKTLYLNRK